MRVSIPALFILSAWIYQNLDMKKVKTNLFQFILLVVLLIGSVTPILQLCYSIIHWSYGPPRFPLIIMIRPAAFAAQYMGKSHSIWGKYLTKLMKSTIIKEKTAFSTKQSLALNKKLNYDKMLPQ